MVHVVSSFSKTGSSSIFINCIREIIKEVELVFRQVAVAEEPCVAMCAVMWLRHTLFVRARASSSFHMVRACIHCTKWPRDVLCPVNIQSIVSSRTISEGLLRIDAHYVRATSRVRHVQWILCKWQRLVLRAEATCIAVFLPEFYILYFFSSAVCLWQESSVGPLLCVEVSSKHDFY